MKTYSLNPQPSYQGPNGYMEDGNGYAILNDSGWKIGEAIEREDALLWIAAPDLLAACKLAKQHLDAMRLESGMGNVLLPFEKAAFEQVDQALTAAIEKAEGE